MLDIRSRKIELAVKYIRENTGYEYTVSVYDIIYGNIEVSAETIPDCLRGIAGSMEATSLYCLNLKTNE